MLSVDYELSVPGFKAKEIGHQTLVRVHNANFQIHIENDGPIKLHKLKVTPVIESYVGQNQPLLFLSMKEQIIDEIPPKSMVPLTFNIWPNYPDLVSIAVHITDANNNDVMAKRKRDKTYEKSPVRWWFYVIDNIYIEILQTLKTLVAQNKNIQKD